LPPIRAFGGERTAEKKNEPREGGDALPDENREEEHRHVVGKSVEVLRLIAFARQGVDKDAHS
jgi:hypothetical protein